MDEKCLKLIKHIEKTLDNLNAEYGSKDAYCMYCRTTTYSGSGGIDHNRYCLMTKLRAVIKDGKDLEDQSETQKE